MADEIPWDVLAAAAWCARANARVLEGVQVGAAVLADDSVVFDGCNVEHRHRCHDIHAEVNAISTMVASGKKRLRAVLVVAEVKRFTPCGGCMDWIMELGGADCLVGFQQAPHGEIAVWKAGELMPHYPQR